MTLGAIIVDGREYVSLAEAVRVSGRSTTWIMRRAAAGTIKTKLKPGLTPRYSRDDIEAMSESTQPAGAPRKTARDRPAAVR